MKVLLYSCIIFALLGGQCLAQPNIVLIVADDLGYNDVSWHNEEIMTPHMGKLAEEGIKLEQAYVQPICTPSRAALMTGRYPIHTGRQHSVLWPREPRGLFMNFTLLPRELKNLGYETHMVGKWHLGFCSPSYLPTRRGFDTYYGFYTGSQDYFTHCRDNGYDLRDGEEVDYNASGEYSTHLFAKRAVEIINKHENNTKPMFLYLAFQSPHMPLQVPKKYSQLYSHIKNRHRRIYSGMVTAMDEAVGNITEALRKSGKSENTLIIFTTDNGGQVKAGASNFPLRGNKGTLWEGGTRAVAFIHGAMLHKTSRVHNGLLHVTDWLPTLVAVAGGNPKDLGAIDGINQWNALARGKRSPRKEMLYNFDPILDDTTKGGAIRMGHFKLIKGCPGFPDDWIHPKGIVDLYQDEDLIHLERYFPHPEDCLNEFHNGTEPSSTLLFDLSKDPYERRDLSSVVPEMVKMLSARLDEYRGTMIPPDITKMSPDGDPSNWGGVWSPGWCQPRPL